MKNHYISNFIGMILLFGLANIIDQANGQSELTKNYPIFIYTVWTGLVATFHYFGWKIIYIANAILLFGIQLYSVFHHPTPDSGSPHWLIGSLPFDLKIMILVPCFIVGSFILQLILLGVGRLRENRRFLEEQELEESID